MEFKYTAVGPGGKTARGVITAENEAKAAALLKKQGLTPVALKPAGPLSGNPGRIKASELIMFTRLFSRLIKAHIPVINALNIILSTLKNRKFAAAVSGIINELSAGKSLSQALKKFPGMFSDFYITTVESGENSGRLAEALQHLYDHLYQSDDMRKKILSAIIYPVTVTLFALAVLTAIIFFLVPQFQVLFEQLGGELPLATRIVIGLNLFLKKYFFLLFALAVGSVVFILVYLRTPAGRRLRDRILLNLPILSQFFRERIFAHFSRILGILLANEVDILKSLSLASRLVKNSVVREGIARAAELVGKGDKISEAFVKAGIFPATMIQMISIGEETGDFGSMFISAAEFYEESLDMRSRYLLAVLQPALIIFTGIIIMFILVSIFLPVFQLSNIIK